MYPREYIGIKPVDVQVRILAKIFGLSTEVTNEWIDEILPSLRLPNGAEGWFAMPSPDAIAKHNFPEVTYDDKKHLFAVELIMKKISALRPFNSYLDGELTPNRFNQSKETFNAFDRILREQHGEIIIIPAQFGMLHRGRSVRYAYECFSENEFGLDIFSVLSMILTHPERCIRFEQLHIICPGDEYSANVTDWNLKSPRICFDGGRLELFACYKFELGANYGLASGFIPNKN